MSSEIYSSENRLKIEDIVSKGSGSIYELTFHTPSTTYPEDPAIFVRNILNSQKLEENQVDSIVIAARELIANAIEHGNKMETNKNIRVICGWIEKDFYFVVQDEGNGFDIKNAGNWFDPEGGYGIPVVKRRVDLLYNFNDPAAYFIKSFS
jgi:serine/threonine-protein kinase RsbW